MAFVPVDYGRLQDDIDEDSGGHWVDVRTLTTDERHVLRGEAAAAGDKTLVEVLEGLN
jgi:hypothetical protein